MVKQKKYFKYWGGEDKVYISVVSKGLRKLFLSVLDYEHVLNILKVRVKDRAIQTGLT